jgi:hypothetical protein
MLRSQDVVFEETEVGVEEPEGIVVELEVGVEEPEGGGVGFRSQTC